ncbi:HAD-IA family hydrolase [Oceanobacillus massiliensis]|uniref:HAD-IA family hydrolase n=1 Tax=Oceanobacillus massiliensis TaxID=1465765 RepID=UPI000289EEF9|nr:HAD-IA family hydrolase [Oceanobacillus massiliensis]
MYKHIIWDFDGTLFDTYPVMANVFKECLQVNGIEEPLENIEKRMRVSSGYALQYYEEKYDINADFIAGFKKKKREIELESAKPYKGILDICEFIHSTGRYNYLFTHRGESSIELLKKYDLYRYFSDFITSKQRFERKPSPAAIKYIIQKHTIKPSEAIMIGDRDLDLLSGKSAGISACYFAEKNEPNNNSDYIINDFQKLYSIV